MLLYNNLQGKLPGVTLAFVYSPVTEIYWELMRLRSQMALARLGMDTSVKVQRSSGHS